MSVPSEIAAYLVSAGYGTEGTDIFQGRLPDSPDSCLVVYPLPGRPALHTMATSSGLEQPRFRVLSRASGYASAFNRAHSAYKTLDNLGHVEISGVLWRHIAAEGPPESITAPRDSTERAHVVIEFTAIKERS